MAIPFQPENPRRCSSDVLFPTRPTTTEYVRSMYKSPRQLPATLFDRTEHMGRHTGRRQCLSTSRRQGGGGGW